MKRISEEESVQSLALMPFVYVLFDFFENIGIDLSLLVYPTKLPLFAFLSGYLTTFKMMALNICFVLISLLSLIAFVKGFVQKIKN